MPNNSLLRLLPVFFLCFAGLAQAQEVPPEEAPVDESAVYIFEDTTWAKDSELIFDRPVMVSGATLTIEEGVKVKFTKNTLGYEPGMLSVQGGRIIAHGTEAKPIVFDRLNSDDAYWIDFYSSLDHENPSFFRYVQFLNGGKTEEILGGGDMTVSPGIPTFKFHEGWLRIENSLWKASRFSDVKAVYPYQWGDLISSLSIVNSNFAYEQSIAEENPSNVIEIEGWPNVAVDASGDECPGDKTCQPAVILKNNYYGDIRGPKGDVSNPDSFLRYGKRILGYAHWDGYRNTSLIADPLFILPGILGSQKDSDGEWILDPILHSYDDLVASLKKNGYEAGKNLFVFPYDWYQKNEDTAALLKQKIDAVKEQTGSDKVDIAAHSMGGLVARAYAETGDQAKNIDQLITLGTPHRGAPETYLKWEAADGFTGIDGKLLKHHFSQEAEESGYAGIYDLIHHEVFSVEQLLSVDNYLFDTVTNSLRTYSDNYPRNEFLEQLNTNENRLDAIRKRVAISGDTGDTTITRIRVTGEMAGEKWQHGKPENFDDEESNRGLERSTGDRTVPLESAQAFPNAEQIVLNAKHSDLPEAAECDVFKELSGKQECTELHEIDIPNILYFNLFSPIDIQVVSPSGKRVGKNFETGEIYNEIPGAFYTGYHTENEFVTIPNPEDGEYKVLTQGTGAGHYRVEVTNISETASGEAQESVATIAGETQSGVETEAKIDVADDTVELSGELSDVIPPLTTLSLSGTQGTNNWYTSDVVATLAATDNENGSGVEKTEYSLDNGATWNLYTEPLAFTTEGSVILRYRSLDKKGNQEETKTETIKIDKTGPEAKITFNSTTKKFEISGTDSLSDVSVVTAEKTELSTRNQKFKPTKRWFSHWYEKHRKNLPDFIATITDEAGHVTSLSFEKNKDRNGFVFVRLQSISYDDNETQFGKTLTQYKWRTDRKGVYRLFASHLQADESNIESHYIPEKNETLIMERSQSLRDDDRDDESEYRPILKKLPGMVVPYIESERGEMRIKY